MMGCLLKWAEDHGGNNVTMQGIQQLINFLDEDPFVINHLLWAFLNVNLTGRAREIFCNVQDSQGFEAWRRIHRHIYSTTERRQDELYHAIHNPKRASTPQEVSGVLEEWDTNQRVFKELGGVPLREDELNNLVLKIVPDKIREDLIFKLRDFKSWHEIKDYIQENARLLMVYGGKHSPVNLATPDNMDEETMARLDDMTMDQVLDELGPNLDQSTIWTLVDRRQQRRSAQGRFARKAPGPAKPSASPSGAAGKDGPMTKDGKPMCANCGKTGHHNQNCPEPKADPGQRPCFKCGKTGHTSSQCKSGIPARAVEAEEQPKDDPTILMVLTDLCLAQLGGARHFLPEDSDEEEFELAEQ